MATAAAGEVSSDEVLMPDEGEELGGMPLPVGGQPKMKQGFGGPCLENKECEDGFCIATPRGFICSRVCGSDDDCAGADVPLGCNRSVENFGADRQRICAPTESSLCQPCFRDEHCFGGVCIGTAVGSVCTTACLKGECPPGSECRPERDDGTEFDTPQCIPDIALCGCTEADAGQTRACIRTAPELEGRCVGQETCIPGTGWSGCDAPEPTIEICDGRDNDCNGAVDDGLPVDEMCTTQNQWGMCTGRTICRGAEGWMCLAEEASQDVCDFSDNDCDGLVDEDFTDEAGIYSSQAHCGGCNRDCSLRFPLAAETECRVSEGQAMCVIVSCREGYFRADESTCAPLASKLCEPCDGDDDCNAVVGDRCIADDDGNRFCGRACGPDSPFGDVCPAGFECGDNAQCRLTVGSCLCGPEDNFIVPCTLQSPVDMAQECVGSRSCAAGVLSLCLPPDEVCDTFDDDCDGNVDEDFTDANGRFTTDAHCGRCNQNCPLLLADPNLRGTGFCLDDGNAARCALRCVEGFADVNGIQVDGCECEIQDPNADTPDLLGEDANCDGIDGEVNRGVFVSPIGDDGNAGTRGAPVRTLTAGLNIAGQERDHVYVAAGVYEESIRLKQGVSLFGGYSADFSRRDIAGNETAIFGVAAVGGVQATVLAEGIVDGQSVMSGFTITGYSNNRPSGNSYAILIVDCDESLRFENNIVRGAAGGPGLRGSQELRGMLRSIMPPRVLHPTPTMPDAARMAEITAVGAEQAVVILVSMLTVRTSTPMVVTEGKGIVLISTNRKAMVGMAGPPMSEALEAPGAMIKP